MWSWLTIILILFTCLFCFISVVQLELRKSSAKIWIILTCCFILGVVGALASVPSPKIEKYSYEPKPPKIEIKKLPEPTIKDQENLRDGANQAKTVQVTAAQLYIRAEANNNALVLGTVMSGDSLIVIEEPANSDWVKVRTTTGLTGWVLKSYVKFLPEKSEQKEDGVKLQT